MEQLAPPKNNVEEHMEAKILKELKKQGIFSIDSYIPIALVSQSPVGIELSDIIGVYCTRGENYSRKHFDLTLLSFGFSAFAIHRLYANIQVLRLKLEELIPADSMSNTVPISADTFFEHVQVSPVSAANTSSFELFDSDGNSPSAENLVESETGNFADTSNVNDA